MDGNNFTFSNNTLDNEDVEELLDGSYLKTDGSGEMGGDIDMNNNKIINVSPGTHAKDGVNLSQLNTSLSSYVSLNGDDTISGVKTFQGIAETAIILKSTISNGYSSLRFQDNGGNNQWDFNASPFGVTDGDLNIFNYLHNLTYLQFNRLDPKINIFVNMILSAPNNRRISLHSSEGNQNNCNMRITSTGLNLIHQTTGIPIMDLDVNSMGTADYGIIRTFRNSNINLGVEHLYYRGDNTENINISLAPRSNSFFHSSHPDDDVRLGIGLENPQAKFHVVGDTRLDGITNINGITNISADLNVSSNILGSSLLLSSNLQVNGSTTTGIGGATVTLFPSLGIGDQRLRVTKNGFLLTSNNINAIPFYDIDIANAPLSALTNGQVRFFRNGANIIPIINIFRGDGLGNISIRWDTRGSSFIHSTLDFLRLGLGTFSPQERLHIVGGTRCDTLDTISNNAIILNASGPSNFYPIRLLRQNINRFDLGVDTVSLGEQFYIFSYTTNSRLFTINRTTGDVSILVGALNMNNKRIINTASPIDPSDCATKSYVDSLSLVTISGQQQTITSQKTFQQSGPGLDNNIILNSIDGKNNNLLRFNSFSSNLWSIGIISTAGNTNRIFRIRNESMGVDAINIDNENLNVSIGTNLEIATGGIIQKVAHFTGNTIYNGLHDSISFTIPVNSTILLNLPDITTLAIGKTFQIYKRGGGVLSINLTNVNDGFYIGTNPRNSTTGNQAMTCMAINWGGQRFYSITTSNFL